MRDTRVSSYTATLWTRAWRAWRIDARVGRKIKGCSRRIRAESLAALLVEPVYAACEELADGADARVGR